MANEAALVARGARLLDQHSPGWAGKVNLDLLNLNDGERCIVGQVYGEFSPGMDALSKAAGTHLPAADYGFMPEEVPVRFTFTGRTKCNGPTLERHWARAVRQRRQAA